MNEQKLARKGTLKRKQQIRDLLSVIDNEDVEEKQNPSFDKKNLNKNKSEPFSIDEIVRICFIW